MKCRGSSETCCVKVSGRSELFLRGRRSFEVCVVALWSLKQVVLRP